MPTDVSSLTPVLRLIYPMSAAMPTPAGTAASSGLNPSMNATTMPGRTECASASPMNDRPRAMTYAPMIGHIAPTSTDTTSARIMKLYWKGPKM